MRGGGGGGRTGAARAVVFSLREDRALACIGERGWRHELSNWCGAVQERSDWDSTVARKAIALPLCRARRYIHRAPEAAAFSRMQCKRRPAGTSN